MFNVFVDTIASRVIGIAVNDNKAHEPLRYIAVFYRVCIFIFDTGRERNDGGNGFRNGIDAKNTAVIFFINLLSGGISIDILQVCNKTAEIFYSLFSFNNFFYNFFI